MSGNAGFAEQNAAKTALQEAAANIAERLLPKLVPPQQEKKTDSARKGKKVAWCTPTTRERSKTP